MNVLVCIGSNTFDYLTLLGGAEKDARDVWVLLVRSGSFYDSCGSRLLESPTAPEITAALSSAFAPGIEVDVFTFFFSGHAIVKSGSLYLCTKESNPERLSTSAFPIVSLFSIISEFRPRQANIIIDACQAGGSHFDLSQLCKPEIIGHSEASSITFLGACTADQYAFETSNGGVLTSHLVKCLSGAYEIQTRSPTLDLIEIGNHISRSVSAEHPNQKPTLWALSLFGSGKFASNPHFLEAGGDRIFPSAFILPTSRLGQKIRAHSAALWDEYRAIGTAPSPARLRDLLRTVFENPTAEIDQVAIVLRELGRTLGAKSAESSERLAQARCLGVCAISLLPHVGLPSIRQFVVDTFQEINGLDIEFWNQLDSSLNSA